MNSELVTLILVTKANGLFLNQLFTLNVDPKKQEYPSQKYYTKTSHNHSSTDTTPDDDRSRQSEVRSRQDPQNTTDVCMRRRDTPLLPFAEPRLIPYRSYLAYITVNGDIYVQL